MFSSDFKEHVKHIEKAVSSKEKNYMSRVVRALTSSRRKLNHGVLRKLIMGYFSSASAAREKLITYLDEVRSGPRINYNIITKCLLQKFQRLCKSI